MSADSVTSIAPASHADLRTTSRFRNPLAAAGLLLFAGAFCISPASADRNAIELTLQVVQEVEVADAGGETRVELIEPTAILPGDEVIYIIHYHNHGDQSAERIVITNQIPEHMTYRADTAGGAGAEVRYSIDGGGSFAPPEALTVTTPDGGVRPAEAEDYTHIRWRLSEPVAPQDGDQVSYRARLD